MKIDAFITAEEAARLDLPALAELRFEGSRRTRRVFGRVERASLAIPKLSAPSADVRVRIHVSREDLTILAANLMIDHRRPAHQAQPIDAGARIVVGHLITLADDDDDGQVTRERAVN